MNYRWVKYRTRHSSGPGQWQYVEVGVDPKRSDEENLKDALEQINDSENTWSEHWRGVEGDFENPPKAYLERHLAHLASKIQETMDEMQRTTALIEAAS